MVDSIAASAGLIKQDEATKSGQARNKLANDLDSFLTLLTTQLKAQDPLSPMDSTEFTNQLVQFAQVEQQIYQNENLEKMLESSAKTQQAMAINFLDSYVEAETDKVMLEDGKAVFTYGLSATAKDVTVMVKDLSGSIVKSYQGAPSAGLHKINLGRHRHERQPGRGRHVQLSVNADPARGRHRGRDAGDLDHLDRQGHRCRFGRGGHLSRRRRPVGGHEQGSGRVQRPAR